MTAKQMSVREVSQLASDLRRLTDSVQHRLWIASPYIGSWNAVKRILGSAWQKVDVRLLTDKESGILAEDTVTQFAAHRPIRSLQGLHAKLYIADNAVLLTSANLTETAFTRRHEVGLILEGEQARRLTDVYESLWELAEEIEVGQISFKRASGPVDEPHDRQKLPKLFDLPPSPVSASNNSGAFADYDYFLDIYRQFVNVYISSGRRDHPQIPLFFETDKFLNYLFHEDPDTPSKKYQSAPYRPISDSKKIEEVKKYRMRYRRAGFPGGDHSETAQLFQEYLAERNIMKLSDTDIKLVAGKLNCFGVLPLALHRFLNGNNRDAVRTAWHSLIHGKEDPKFRMNDCDSALFGFGKSAIQEMLGYYYPEKFPLRNVNTNAGLRFFGYNVK